MLDQEGIKTLHLGVDDLDTFGWGCTTYFIYSLLKEVKRSSVGSRLSFLDLPLLTRLNPSIPLRTRGNGALSIHVAGEESDLKDVIDIALSLLDRRLLPGREPGVVSLVGEMPPKVARKIYMDLLTDIAEISYIERVIEKIGGKIHIAGKGIIGALGSISHFYIEGDCTYEIIAYSDDVERVYIDPGRLVKMDRETRPLTFNNIDPETNKILVKPSTGAPVALGIRGESPEVLLKAYSILEPENISGYAVFRTNQGTDQHLVPRSIADAKFYRTGLFSGLVASSPRIIQGGDVVISISDGASEIDVAIYREAGDVNRAARALATGDLIAVGGSVKPWISGEGEKPVINTEYLRIIRLSDQYVELPPKCPRCSSSMESLGRGKGYRCRKCGYRDPGAKKILVKLERGVSEGIYKPPPRNMKHLMKPLTRIGLEKICRPSRFKKPLLIL
jgi:tRNA(Ile2)-agmatinylcytidine synthase